jgi:hypothetical protein
MCKKWRKKEGLPIRCQSINAQTGMEKQKRIANNQWPGTGLEVLSAWEWE